MNAIIQKRRGLSAVLTVAGVASFALSAALLVGHAQTVYQAKEVSLPLVASLPDLEKRVEVLQEQVELAEFHNSVSLGSTGERIDAYALPKEINVERLIESFDLLSSSLNRNGFLGEMSEVSVGDEEASVQFSAHKEGINRFLTFIRLSGLLTVGDALEDSDIALLYSVTEEENPTGIVAVEKFLSQDLLRYARDPKAFQEILHRSFSSTAFANALRTITQTTLLRDAEKLFEGDLGRGLAENHLWPQQYMTVQNITLERGGAEGWYRVKVDIILHMKDAANICPSSHF